MIKVAPSLLASDFSKLAEEVKTIENADMLHLDVMDGHFVPNLTFGPGLISALRDKTELAFDTHLMISNPEDYIEDYAEAGSDYITFHIEATDHSHRLVQRIKDAGCKAGVSLNPGTSLEDIKFIIPDLDLVLIMSVNPGFGGQKYIPQITEKISDLNKMINNIGDKKAEIAVDGGIKLHNVNEIIKAGADIIIAGSAIFGSENRNAIIEKFKTAGN